MDREWDVFIAHAGADIKVAERLYDSLFTQLRTFLDSRCLLPGDDWDTALASAQRRSAITVVLLSSVINSAYYAREEIAAAISFARDPANEHRLIPVVIGSEAYSAAVPYGLRLKHRLHLPDPTNVSFVASEIIRVHNATANPI